MGKIQIRYMTVLLVLLLVCLVAFSCRPTIVQSEDSSYRDRQAVPQEASVDKGDEIDDPGTDDQEIESEEIAQEPEEEVPGYLTIYEGLHITGTPVEVDIDDYRLVVKGNVKRQIELSFEEVKALESISIYSELNCPGFFIDKGNWTGIPLKTILDLAGVKDGASEVSFISIDESYQKQIPVEEAFGEGMLVAYEFEDKEFSKYHGFPLRLVADQKAGSYWVKWLGIIEVT